MDVLRELQASLAQLLGQEFDQAEQHLNTLLEQRAAKNEEIHKKRLEQHNGEYAALDREFGLRGAKIKELEDRLRDLDKWHERALEAETLREDNAELQRELEALRSRARATSEDDGSDELLQSLRDDHPDPVIQHLSTEHGYPDTIPYGSYTELAKRYRNLFHTMGNLVKAFTTLRSQHRLCKSQVKDWHKLFEKETFTVAVNGKPTTFRRAGENEPRTLRRARPDRAVTSNDREPALGGDLEKPDVPSTSKEQYSGGEAGSTDCNDHLLLPQPPMPASTAPFTGSPRIKVELGENDSEEVQEIPNSTPASTLDIESDNVGPQELHGDSPVTSRTAGSRSLKRKQQQREKEEMPAPNSSGYFPTSSSRKPVTVKSEQMSSSPLQNLMQQRGLNDLDTQDLDEIDNSVQTPKKKNAYYATNVTNLPFPIFQEEGSPEPTRRAPSDSQSDEQPGGHRPNHASALQPKDCNKSIVRRPDPEDPGRDAKRRRGDRRGAEAIHIITEDGEDEFYKGRGKGRSSLKKPNESGRLNNLLEAPSSPKMALTPRTAPQSAGAKVFSGSTRDPNGYGRLSLGTPSKIDLIRTTASARQPAPTFTVPGQPRVSVDNARFNRNTDRSATHDEPYRSRTVERLSLDNFRINPDRNEGIDYAFDDMVRKRDQRQCLPGCTRPDCCGSRFRAMAKHGGLRALPGRESADEDLEILENYLGDQKHKLKTMSEDERDQLLIDARAEALAARYGKHRYAHERHNSPPGFWRTDMPSTQEQERDWEEARQMEREKVASRYREAMRPGGMWKFADE